MSETLRFHLDPAVRDRGIAFDAPRLGDAGFDIRSVEDVVIESGRQVLISTGLKVAIPLNWVGLIKDRSSVAFKQELSVHAGVIDASYRGEVKVLLSNRSRENVAIEAGTRIAQMVVVPHLGLAEEVDTEDALGDTSRGEAGFGSTGTS